MKKQCMEYKVYTGMNGRHFVTENHNIIASFIYLSDAELFIEWKQNFGNVKSRTGKDLLICDGGDGDIRFKDVLINRGDNKQ